MENENLDSPYMPPKAPYSFAGRDGPEDVGNANGVLILVVGLLAFMKWFIPAAIGTGSVFSLGTWIEEWVLVVSLGVMSGLVRNRPCVREPLVFFLVAYLLMFPIYARDKFYLLVLCFGIGSTYLMFGASFLGAIARRLWSSGFSMGK